MKFSAVLSGFLVFSGILTAQPSIRLRAQSGEWRRTVQPVTAARGSGHYILVFNSRPTEQTQRELKARGIRVIDYVPDTGLMVSLPPSVKLDGLGISYTTRLQAGEKISPSLENSASNYYLVIFHRDVEAAKLREVAQAEGFDILDHPQLLPHQILAAGSYYRLRNLAAHDEVSYILPASPELVSGAPVVGCPGAVTANGSVGEYVIATAGWSKDSTGGVELKYAIQNLTQKMDPTLARAEIERAFREWARYARLTFTSSDRADGTRTVGIRFAPGAHGDGYPFDGRGRVLAHTFYPSPASSEPIAGDMHFDADEDWAAGSGVDLFSVALHELGHALGLGHSTQPGAVMYPYYRQTAALTEDDIAGVQALYGPPEQPGLTAPPLAPGGPVTPPLVPPSTPSTPPEAPAAPATDTTAPAIKITSPGTTLITTTSPWIVLAGTATDNVGVTAVTWTGVGTSGAASGLSSWSATVPLLVGTNTIVVRAFDAAGNSAWRSITVVRR